MVLLPRAALIQNAKCECENFQKYTFVQKSLKKSGIPFNHAHFYHYVLYFLTMSHLNDIIGPNYDNFCAKTLKKLKIEVFNESLSHQNLFIIPWYRVAPCMWSWRRQSWRYRCACQRQVTGHDSFCWIFDILILPCTPLKT